MGRIDFSFLFLSSLSFLSLFGYSFSSLCVDLGVFLVFVLFFGFYFGGLFLSLGPAEDEHDVLWHYVSEEKPTVCLECGQFFKMEKVSHTDMFVDPNEHH